MLLKTRLSWLKVEWAFSKLEDSIGVKLAGMIKFIPLRILFDYASAFPSVALAWMFLVLQAIEFPYGILKIVKSLYDANQAFFESAGGVVKLSLVFYRALYPAFSP